MNINHLSVSRYNLYKECEQKYKFKYHLKVPSPKEEQFHFTYGKVIHKVAEEFIELKGEKSLQDILLSILTGEMSLERSDQPGKRINLPKDFQVRVPDHLRSIEKLNKQVGVRGELEWEFKYDLDPPNEKFVYGFIDRIIQEKDHFFVLDYKTTKKGGWRKNINTVKDDIQLKTYALMVREHYNVPAKNIYTALYYLEGADLIGARFTEDDLDKTKEELLKSYNSIQDKNPDKVWGNVGFQCERCDYKSLCPFVANGKNRISIGAKAYELPEGWV